jgi:hypothetical protein
MKRATGGRTMKNWRTKKALYRITEISKYKYETYPILATGAEIQAYLKSKRENYGYIQGLGGDKTYDCFAVLANN